MIRGAKNVQRLPLVIRGAQGAGTYVFVETAYFEASKLFVFGWATSESIRLSVTLDGDDTKPSIRRYARPDVAEKYGSRSSEGLGFALSVDTPDKPKRIELGVEIEGRSERLAPLEVSKTLSPNERVLIPELMGNALDSLRQQQIGSAEWRSIVDSLPILAAPPRGHGGFIEGLLFSPEGGAVVFGWAMHPSAAFCWLESDDGQTISIANAFRRPRRDIQQAYSHLAWSMMDCAFVCHLPGACSGQSVRLRMATEKGLVTVSERGGTELLSEDPRKAAETLFSIETEVEAFRHRVALVDWPLVLPLIVRHQEEVEALPVKIKTFGPATNVPEVSVIVPLYNRYDFIEHQLLEFARDPSFAERCELIYVVDDPSITENVLSEANVLAGFLDVPFSVVVSSANRGFSGANNLGASRARGKHLLFLNSDVIPRHPGWLDAMLDIFENEENVAVVGAQLLFPDGSLQHAGIEFHHFGDWDIWTNLHPGSGTSPEFDRKEPRDVPAVTGACLMVSRAAFDEIGGWDTEYLVGDFEDSDLCLAARSKGYRVVYQPAASLTHLERQSFTGVGADSFRNRMTICNAVRHEQKWHHLLAGSDAANETAAHGRNA